MLAVVPTARASFRTATACLTADYLEFDRRRRECRPYVRMFAGFAALVLIGGAIGSVPRMESIEAAGVFIVPVCGLLLVHAWQWSRLQHRLGAIRAQIQQVDS